MAGSIMGRLVSRCQPRGIAALFGIWYTHRARGFGHPEIEKGLLDIQREPPRPAFIKANWTCAVWMGTSPFLKGVDAT